MKLCGFINWCKIGWLIVFVNLLVLPYISYSQDLPPIPYMGVTTQHAIEGSSFSYSFPNAFTIENNGSINYEISAPGWLSGSGTAVSGTPGAEDIGSHTITVRASNSNNSLLFSELSFSIVVHPAGASYAAFTMNTNRGCESRTVNFINLSQNASSYHWEFGNGNNSNEVNPSATFNGANSYIVTLTINQGQANESSTQQIITIFSDPEPEIGGTFINGCEPLQVNLVANGDVGVYYYWDFSQLYPGQYKTETSINLTDLPNGVYDVHLETTASNGCKGATFRDELFEVYDKPIATFSYSKANSCEPSLTTFTNETTVEGGNISSSQWNINGTNYTSNNLSVEHDFTPSGPGSYNVSLITTTNNGCISEEVLDNITFNSGNTASFNVNDLYCNGNNLNINAQTSPIAESFQWLVDGNIESTSSNLSYTLNNPGTTDIELIAAFSDGCVRNVNKQITVEEVSANFNYSVNYICGSGYDVEFVDNSYTYLGNDIIATNWSLTDGTPLSTSPTFTHRFGSAGTYIVRLVAISEDGCQSSVEKTIQLIQPTVDISIGGAYYGCLGDETYFTASYNSQYDTANSYTWDFGDGTGNGVQDTFVYTNSGIYDVSVSVTSNTGCIVTAVANNAVALSSPPVISLFNADETSTCYSGGSNLNAEFNFADTLVYETPSEITTIEVPAGNTSHGFNYYPYDVGTYSIYLTAYNYGCPSAQASVNLEALNPKANFIASNTTFCSGGDHVVNFNNVSNFTPNKTIFEWDFDDGSPLSNEISPSHTYSNAGDYNVTLTVTDTSNFCSHTYSQEINIYTYTPGGTNLITADNDEGCAPLLVNSLHEFLTDQLSGNYVVSEYLWDFNNDGTFDDTTSTGSVTYTYDTPGRYSVKLKVTSNSGCNYEVVQNNLIQATGPVVDFTYTPSAVCIDDTLSYSNETNHPAGETTNTTYLWNFGDGDTSTDYEPEHVYTSEGLYTVRLEANDDNGCSSSIEKEDYINVQSVTAGFTVSNTIVCSNDEITFESTSYGDIEQYHWDFDGGGVDLITTSSEAVNFSFPSAGNYTVTLTVIASNGCEDSYSSLIEIINATANFSASDDFITSTVDIGCANTSFTTFKPLTEDENVQSYLWDFGDGNTSTLRSPKHWYRLPGNYTVSLEINFVGNCQRKVTKTNYIIAAGAFGVFTYDNTPQCSPNNVQFNISNMSSVQYITLDYGNGNILNDTVAISTNNYPTTYTYVNPDIYGETTPALTLADDACGAYTYNNVELGSIYTSALPTANLVSQYDSICKGVPIQFSSNLSTSNDLRYVINRWHWDFGTTVSNTSEEQNPVFAYPGKGIFKPQLVVTNELGCSDTIIRPNGIQIYGNDALKADFDFSPTLACPNMPIDFISDDSTNALSPIISYEWNFGEGYVSGETATYSFNETHKGMLVPVTHIVTDDKFCTDSTTRTVEIDNLQAAIGYEPQPVYRGSLVDFTDESSLTPGTTISNWNWTFENATPGSSTAQNPQNIEFTTIFNENTTSLLVTNNIGCTDEITIQFDIENNPPTAYDFEVTVIVSSQYPFKGIDFDNNGNPPNDHFDHNDPGFGQSLEGIKIVSLPNQGTLMLGSSFIYEGQEITYNQISNLRYIPAYVGSSSFEWQGNDGTDWSNTATVNIDVKAEPGPPRLDNIVFNVPEDSTVRITRDDFINKITSDLGNNLQFDSLRISAVNNPAAGQLFFNGIEVSGQILIRGFDIDNDDAVFQFEPIPAFNGVVSYYWNANDGYSSAVEPAQIIINYINMPPELTNIERYGLAQGSRQVIDKSEFLSNYKDENLNDSPVTLYINNIQPSNAGTFAHGVTIISDDDSVLFENLNEIAFYPFEDFEGIVTATWLVSDGDDKGSAQIIFEYINEPPIVHSFTLNVDEDIEYQFSINDFDTGLEFPFEDIDPRDKAEIVEIVSLPLYGALTFDGNEVISGQYINRDEISLLSYLTNFDWHGTDTVYYNASDGTDWAANDSFIVILAAPVNDAPRPNPDFWTINEDQTLSGVSVALNDNDIDDDNSILKYSVASGDSATAGEFGTIVLLNNGNLTFIPDQDINGTLYFVYTVCDDDNACATDTVWITLNPINDPPTAVSDIFNLYENTKDTTLNCLTNDFDIDGDPVRLLAVENDVVTSIETKFGVLNWDVNGNISITLNLELDTLKGGETVEDDYEYIIGDPLNSTDTSFFTIRITGLNDPPKTNDIEYYTEEGVEFIQSGVNYRTIISNDFDPEGDPISVNEINFSSIRTIENEYGKLIWSSDGHWEFYQNTILTNTLKQDETLDVVYTYTAKDIFSAISDPASIIIHIEGVNDTPIANNDTLVIYEDEEIVFVSATDIAAMLYNDSDIDGDNFKVTRVNNNVSGNVNGTVGLLHWNSDGSFSYEARQDSVNQLGAFDQIQDEFTYYITDDFGAPASAQLVIIIKGLNDAPIAEDDVLLIYENTYTTTVNAEFGLLSNDGDADHDPIIVAVNNLGTHVLQGNYGILTWESNGAFTYETDSTLVDTLYYLENVVDTFTYRITDPIGETDKANLYITIIGENDAPVAKDHTESITEDELVLTVDDPTIGILAEDSDIDDNDNFGITLVNNQSEQTTTGTFGSLEWNYDGTFTYTLNPEIDSISATEMVIDSFLYVIEDPYDSTDWAYLIIEINGLNDNPEAQPDFLVISEDTLVYLTEVSLLENDRDTDGDFIKQNSFNNEITSPINTYYASFDWDSTGYYTYRRHISNNLLKGIDTLAFDDIVHDSIPYSIVDNYNYSSDSYLLLTIKGENDAPVAIRDNNLLSENTPSISSSSTKHLLYNDYEIDRRDSVMLYKVNNETDYSTDAVYGTLTWNENGSYTYSLNFEATDTLYYREQVHDLIPYTIIDKQGATTTDTLEITIIGANDKPIANNDTVDINEDERFVSILPEKKGIITNDVDVDGDEIIVLNPNGEAIDSLIGVFGILIVESNGQAKYILNEEMDSLSSGELQEDYFTYTINDGRADALGEIIIRIIGENDLPVAFDDFVRIDEDTDSIIAKINNENALLFHDYDIDGDTISIISINDSSLVIAGGNYGELQWDSTGAYIYVTDKERSDRLAEGDTVNEHFTYIVSDTFEGKDTASLTIEIIGINDPPVALSDTYQTFDVEAVIINTSDTTDILDNDYDVDGEANHITLVEDSDRDTVFGNWGVLNWLSDGSFTYQPDSALAIALRPDEYRTDVFKYTIEDDLAASDTSTISFNIIGINNAPTAFNDSIQISEDEVSRTLDESVLFNDMDPDLDTLVVTKVEGETDGTVIGFYGTVTWNNKGEITYTTIREHIDQIGPRQNETETYTYSIIDEGGLSTSAEIVVRIIGENDPIVANDDYVTLSEDTSILVDVLANDIDPDNNYEGNLAKTPVTVLIQPSNGTASVNSANGFIFYVPNKDYSGKDSLQYRVCDDENSCDLAWVHFDIIPINDPPVATNLVLRTPLNTPIGFNAFNQVFDVDDGINPTSINIPSYPDLQLIDESIIYTPPHDSSGRVEFIYSVADYANQRAYVVVTVIIQDEGFGAQNDTVSTNENTAINIEVLENDTLNGFVAEKLSLDILIFPKNGIASYSPFDHYITYEPYYDYNGHDSLTYIIGSSSGTWDYATVYITVEPINSPIIVSDDDITTTINQAVEIPIFNNDFDADNGIDSSSVIIRNQPQYGSVIYNAATGLVKYVPDTDFKGYDTFTYELCDLDTFQTSCGKAKVYIRVKSKFDDLEAQNDNVYTMENTPVTIDYNYLIANDVVGDGVIDPASFTIITGTQHGTYIFNETSSTISYTPFDNYFGYDWLTYQVCDTDTSCDMAQVNIWIQEVNTPPIANNDQFVVTNNTKKRFNVLLNDYDIDGTLNWTSLDTISGKGPRKGSIEFDRTTGTILYLPAINADIDQFTYTICDDEGLCSEANVTISVDLGSTILYNQITNEDTPDTFAIAPLLANYNFFFNVVNYSEVVGPNIGTWKIINNNTQIVYTPEHDSIGYDYYNLTLYSPGKDTVDLKVTVTIIPVNDAPVAINDTVTWNVLTKEITISFNDILKNDYDVDGDSIFLTENAIDYGDSLHVIFNTDSTITISADTIFWCDAWFTYEITDSSGANGIGTVHIFPVLDGIIANKDTLSVDENTYIDIDVLANDLFKDKQRCTIDTIIVSRIPENGNAYTTEHKTITYTPTYHYYGPDSLMYTIIDIWGQIDSAWVLINVIQRNTPPVAVNDEMLNDFGSELTIPVLVNDYDPDSDGFIDTTRIYLNIDEYPQNGDVWFDMDSGVFVYTPIEFTCESDQFNYTIFDNEGDSATATVFINLPEEAPLYAVTDTVKTWPGVPVEFNVLSNDGGYFLPYIETYSNPNSGTIEQTGDSTFMFYPFADFMGNDSMTYQLVSPCENETMGYVLFMIEELKVPEIISPNNDGKNDVLIIDGIQYFPDALLQIYNRYGHIVYQRKAYNNDWGGYSNQGSLGGNKPLPSGTYFYTLTYNEGRNKQAGIIYIFR